ncbi:MAG: 4Fe-4S dicluster domain-containing protein [Nitrospirae bacterium]|nr:4Fe-4S dicluster domain-containing protein [Nitrospirota bacterium]
MSEESGGFLERGRFGELFDRLLRRGYRTVAPVVREGTILYADVTGPEDLPRGLHDLQAPGSYRLEEGPPDRCFAWANGPQALKPLLFAPRETLWESRRNPDGSLFFTSAEPSSSPLAVIGVRACDLSALALQDRHFGKGPFPDPAYALRRRDLFLVAVDCSHPADTCFCVSTGDGPDARTAFDLALGEIDTGFLVRPGSEKGRDLLRELALASPDRAVEEALKTQSEQARACQTRRLPSQNLRDDLAARLDHPHWDTLAARCLSCGNCTSVCPTCFCFSEREEPALDGHSSRHLREWDSCFTAGHSYIHPAPLRATTGFRYRQWLTHKLAYWHDQYGRSGCVGCGRCLSWCPVGIDFTEDVPVLLGPPDGN